MSSVSDSLELQNKHCMSWQLRYLHAVSLSLLLRDSGVRLILTVIVTFVHQDSRTNIWGDQTPQKSKFVLFHSLLKLHSNFEFIVYTIWSYVIFLLHSLQILIAKNQNEEQSKARSSKATIKGLKDTGWAQLYPENHEIQKAQKPSEIYRWWHQWHWPILSGGLWLEALDPPRCLLDLLLPMRMILTESKQQVVPNSLRRTKE